MKVRFNSVSEGVTKPTLAVYSIGPDGRPLRKLAALEGENLSLPGEVLSAKTTVAVGPDVQDPKMLPKQLMVTYKGETLAKVQSSGVFEIPKSVWQGWLVSNACVSGKAEKCSFEFWSSIVGLEDTTHPQTYETCAPICNGTVEVYEQLCCCRWWLSPIDISSILAKLRHVVAIRPWPPIPGPGPVEEGLLREVQMGREAASIHPMVPPTPLPFERSMPYGVPSFNPQAELLKIQAMPKEDAVKYVSETEYLRPLMCTCSVHKVGEALLNPDGTFSFCYLRPPILYRQGTSCTYKYMYKVKQWDGNSWVYVYDGVALGQSFPQDQSALLETFSGHACDPGPQISHDGPYVMLENIGDTQSWRLSSQAQTAELALGPLPTPDNGGLVTPYLPLATPDEGAMANCPWGGTIQFRLRFHPEMTGSIGAKYYRVSVVPTNDGRTPSGAPLILKNPVAWNYFQVVSGSWKVLSQTLGPQSPSLVGGEQGLYSIPDPGTDWEWYQFHNYLNSNEVPDGRYFVVVEIFDSSGTRLKPTIAPGAGTPKSFVFLRWAHETTLSDVPFADLVHLFWIDNKRTHAHIDDLREDGSPNTAECQYLEGTCADKFSIGYRAYHSTVNSITPPETFMLQSKIWYKRGLGYTPPVPPGPEWSYVNEPPTLGVGPSAESNQLSFCDLLGIAPGEHKKCSFAVNLYVWAKHWNGRGRISQYDSSDEAAFSLEV